MSSRIRALVVTAIAALSIAVVTAPASAAPGPLKPAEAVCKAQGGEFVFSGPTASLLCSRPSPFSDAQFRAASGVCNVYRGLFLPNGGLTEFSWRCIGGAG